MPLVNMKPVLREAMQQGYAVAAFNLVDYGTTKAMVKAAEELNAPVICQTSTKTIQYWSHREIVSWVRTVAEVRHAFSKYGGHLGAEGSVAFQFKHCGQFVFAPGTNEAPNPAYMACPLAVECIAYLLHMAGGGVSFAGNRVAAIGPVEAAGVCMPVAMSA